MAEVAEAPRQSPQFDLQPLHAKATTVGPSTSLAPSEADRQAGARELIAAMAAQLDESFERSVHQCLRHLSEYVWLGQSEQAAELLIKGANQIERGKAVGAALLGAIESLRPAGAPPIAAQAVPPID